jgi:hypothetical protein
VPDNTVTLVLDGRVPLSEFAKGMVGFNELVSALSEEVANGSVGWVLDDLQYSSAIATARGEGSTKDIDRVVLAYADVGKTLEARDGLRYGPKVLRAVEKIVDISVERVRFETASSDALIPLKTGTGFEVNEEKSPSPMLQIVRSRKPAFGGITGRIQTLTSRGGLRFTLFDTHQDKAVSCYFEEGKQDQVRDLWGKMAVVEGMIARDPVNGRPLAIREVREITPLPEPCGRYDFELARGASPSRSGMSATEAIRKVRDAQ